MGSTARRQATARRAVAVAVCVLATCGGPSGSTASVSTSSGPSVTTYSVSPASLSFGSVQVGEVSKPLGVKVTNSSTDGYELPSPSIQAGWFSTSYPPSRAPGPWCQDPGLMTLASGKSCYVWVHFQPGRTGSLPGTLELITRSTGHVAATVSLSGTGTAAATTTTTAGTSPPQAGKCADFTATEITRKTFEVGVYNDVRLTVANVGTCGAWGRAWSEHDRLVDPAHERLVHEEPQWVRHEFPRIWIGPGKSVTLDVAFEPLEGGTYELHACAVAEQGPDSNRSNTCTTRSFRTGAEGRLAAARTGGEATHDYVVGSDCRPDFRPVAIDVGAFAYREANRVRVTVENDGDCDGYGHFWSSRNEVSDPAVMKATGYQDAQWWPYQQNDLFLGSGDTATVDYFVQPLERGRHRLHACITADDPEDAEPANACMTREVLTGQEGSLPPMQARPTPTFTPGTPECKPDFTVTGIFTRGLDAGGASIVRVQAQNIGTCDAWGTIWLTPAHPEGEAPASRPAESPQLFIPSDESATFDFKLTPADNGILELHACAKAVDPADDESANDCRVRKLSVGAAGGYVVSAIPRPQRTAP